MVKRNLLIGIIVLILISSTFTGCGKGATEQTTTTSDITNTSIPTTSTSTTLPTSAAVDLHINPPEGATGISITPTFTWDSVEGTVTYEFVITEDRGTEDKFATIDFETSTPFNSYTLKFELKKNTTYWWRVQSVGRAGKRGGWSAGSFTTGS